MKGLFESIRSIKTIEVPDEYSEKYELVDLDNEMIRRLKKVYKDINENKDIIVYKRGELEKKNFISKMLYKFFVVGKKSKFFLIENSNDLSWDWHNENNEEKLKKEIKRKVKKLNKKIRAREKKENHNIGGKIKIEQLIEGKKVEELRGMLKFICSIHHNIGEGSSYKSKSGFVSGTLDEKLDIAKKFAIGRSEGGVNGDPIIIIAFLDKKSEFYIRNSEMLQKLNESNVIWYDDAHEEILIMDGIFPHHIFGILKVNSNDTYDLIVNYWLIKELENKAEFEVFKGIDINQTNFNDYAKDLNYIKKVEERNLDDRRMVDIL